MMGFRVFAATLVTAMLVPAAGRAQDRPLPAFTVTGASGTPLVAARVTSAQRWLLVYVPLTGAPGARLLRALDEWSAGQSGQIVVVVAGPAAAIDTTIRPLLPSSSSTVLVYADEDGGAARALGLTSAPALVGVEQGAINWMVQGVLNDPQMVESLVRSWLRP